MSVLVRFVEYWFDTKGPMELESHILVQFATRRLLGLIRENGHMRTHDFNSFKVMVVPFYNENVRLCVLRPNRRRSRLQCQTVPRYVSPLGSKRTKADVVIVERDNHHLQ